MLKTIQKLQCSSAVTFAHCSFQKIKILSEIINMIHLATREINRKYIIPRQRKKSKLSYRGLASTDKNVKTFNY